MNCVLDSKNFKKDYSISKIFRNENIKKEKPHNEVSLAFNCPNHYSYFKKGSEKGSDSNDFPCNVLKLTKRKNADQAFFFCIDSY